MFRRRLGLGKDTLLREGRRVSWSGCRVTQSWTLSQGCHWPSRALEHNGNRSPHRVRVLAGERSRAGSPSGCPRAERHSRTECGNWSGNQDLELPVDLDILKASGQHLNNRSTWNLIRIHRKAVEKRDLSPILRAGDTGASRSWSVTLYEWDMGLDPASVRHAKGACGECC